jgi:hypothetical protein
MQTLTPADLAARRDRAAQMRQVGLTSPYPETRAADPLTDPVGYIEQTDAAAADAELAELVALANEPAEDVNLIAESDAWLSPRRH